MMNYPTSKQLKTICPNSVVQEIDLPSYEIELDFNNNEIEQKLFFERHEKEFKINETVTCLFKNKIIPEANLLSITPRSGYLCYQLSYTIWRNCWLNTTPIESFIRNLVREAKNLNFKIEFEGHDVECYYLLITAEHKPEILIGKRTGELSRQLLELINM